MPPTQQDSTAIQGLPAGATIKPVAQATPDPSQVQGLPKGATLKPIDSGATASTSDTGTPAAQPQDARAGFGYGVLKGAGETVSGISHLINKIPYVGETLAPSAGIGALDKMDKSNSTAESVGKGVEGIAEFAAGDEALEGMAKLTKVPEAVLALAEKYPKAAKMIHAAVAATKGAIVGGTQGAAKGAAAGDAVAGAEGGATGGAIGGALGGALEPTGGNAVDSLTRAVRPTGKLAQNFAEKAELAIPRLAAEHANTPITNLDELSDAAHKAATDLWQNEIMPQIQKHAEEIIPGKPVATAIRGEVLAGDTDLFPGTADAAEEFAKKFDGTMTLQQASDRLQSLNRKLSSLYKLDPASRYAATANSPTVEAMESGANELRARIYSKLESLGEDDPAGLRQTYGALKTVEQAAEKRAIVHSRLAPINLAQQLATAGGLLHAAGHLAVGDVPGAVAGAAPILAAKAAKTLNSPEYLISKSLDGTGGAVARLAAKAGEAGANVGSQVGQGVAAPDEEQ